MDDITVWMKKLADGDARAEQVIWDSFFSRLVRLAKQRLRSGPGSALDEEDIALSAMGSFYDGLANGKYPSLNDREELWKLLATMTIRKTITHRRREMAQKRNHSAESDATASPRHNLTWEPIDTSPSPEVMLAMSETCDDLILALDDERLRLIALRKLEGYSNEEIADELRCAVRTIERKLARIRQLLEHRV